MVLDSARDGLTQIAEAVANTSNIDALHIISHGNIGSLTLGSSSIDSSNLSDYQAQLVTIGNALSATGDILLYGCDVAQGDTGQQFIKQLAQYTGADVAASTDLTGTATQGGDWVLEANTGSIEAASFSVVNYQHTLLAYSFQYLDTISASTIAGLAAGQPVKITVTLDNGGASLNSQTWTAANLTSVSFNFNNGALLTTFSSPWGAGLTVSAGNFVTDANGALTSVMSNWNDQSVSSDYSSNGAVTPANWFLNGGNGIYYDDVNAAYITNVASISTPAAWTTAPTLTAFSAAVQNTASNTAATITLGNLLTQGNEADVDGTVTGFVIQAVTTGTLLIGATTATATPLGAGNNTVDATHNAYWTPAINANGTLNAFTAVAQDNVGAVSATPVQAKVAVSAPAPASNSYSFYIVHNTNVNPDFTVNYAMGDIVTDSNQGTDTVIADASYVLGANNIEKLMLIGDAVAGGGNDLNNVITGNAANNIINGGGGANTLIGGDGNDYYFVASSADVIIEFASQGTDIVFSTASDYTLADNVEHLIVWGNGLNGTGNVGNNIIFGNALNNTLADGAGSDILVGGGGQDTYNLSVDNTTDTLYIGVGDSLVTGYDKANNFNLGTGLATPAGTDRLDLPTTLIASDTPAVGGAIAGSSITGASISNGIISFQGMGGVAIPATALTLSDALSYIQANITDGNTVAFVTREPILLCSKMQEIPTR